MPGNDHRVLYPMPALTQDQKVEGVRALLNPRSVAIVGASDRPGNWSMRVFHLTTFWEVRR